MVRMNEPGELSAGTEQNSETTQLTPVATGESPEASATQLTILLSAATSAIDEEFKRSERLDAKSRNQLTVTAGFFAGVQAVSVGLINGTLGAGKGHPASSFVVWIAGGGVFAAVALVVAVCVSYASWKLRDDPTLSINTIRAYLDAARRGNPAVGVKLVSAYADVADGRRKNNAARADALDRAAFACGATLLFVGIELVFGFVAVAVR